MRGVHIIGGMDKGECIRMQGPLAPRFCHASDQSHVFTESEVIVREAVKGSEGYEFILRK